jgi:predicted nucleic acid-binding protein
VIAVDSSVAIAAFSSWHEHHGEAVRVFERGPRLIAHVAFETYSVLTRLPPPHRADPSLVLTFLEEGFRAPFLLLPVGEQHRLLATCTRLGLTGGAAYDALIAATALRAGASLVSLDRRALATYQAVGVGFELLA